VTGCLSQAQHRAGEFAQEFIDRTPHTELGIFTLRKAFEMGFLRGFLYHNEERFRMIELIAKLDSEILLADGFDDCLIGLTFRE
jgi:hypothetical protein